jgi:hypothetical protein
MRKTTLGTALLLLSTVIVSQSGCAVPQRPGQGKCMRLVEPETNTTYWLYLPEDYMRANGQRPNNAPWPMVVTLHGLRPYDDANPQIRSWQEEADRYGLIVIAPALRTCDSLVMQLPLRDPSLPYVCKDEKGILAVMDEVCRRTNADPSKVLLTSFSSGGYMAHFMMNRHPERFLAMAPMGSNFNAELLDYTQIPKYRRARIGIFFGENDLKICRDESLQAVEWYRHYRFDVEARQVVSLGHERRPQLASAFFAEVIGITPKTPPDLANLVMHDVTTDGQPRPPSRSRAPIPLLPASTAAKAGSRNLADRSGENGGTVLSSSAVRRVAEPATVAPIEPPARTPSAAREPLPPPTPRRPVRQPYSQQGPDRPIHRIASPDESLPGGIRLQGEPEGTAPMWVRMSVELPLQDREDSSVLWLDNGKPIGASSLEANTVLWHPGEHTIEACVTLPNNRRTVFTKTINVLPGPASQPAEQ